jgi:hypothetical protein
MKTLRTAIWLGFSMGFLTTAAAEPFKDKTNWPHQTTPSQQTTVSQASYPIQRASGFNDRGGNWVATVSPNLRSTECKGNEGVTLRRGFKDKNSPDLDYRTSTSDELIASSSTAHREGQC